MFVRCHLPMELDTGPGTRKSSTLCSLVLLLLVIATFLVCEVPGQMKEEIVGLGNHKRTGNKVELNPYAVKVTEKNFSLTEYKGRFRDACDIKIEKDYIELQYNEDGKGCIVDLLSKNKDKIKLTAVVRNRRGGIKKCLDGDKEVEDSYNNNVPFVYSVSNEVIEKLNKGLNDDSMEACKNICTSCMTRTSLEVSWSRHKEIFIVVDEAERGLSQGKYFKDQKAFLDDGEVTFDLEITATGKFTMNFEKHEVFALKDTVCVAETGQTVKPEAWTITNTDLRDKHLLVFSPLSRNSTLVFEGKEITFKKQSMPHCELFVRFKRQDYELLYVKPPPATTTTTVKTTTKSCPTVTEAATCAPCPPTSAPCPSTSTLSSDNDLMTTTAAKSISSPAVKCPAESKCPEESRGWLYILIAVIVVCVVIVGVLAWFWRKRNSEEKKLIVKHEEELYALYQAEEKVKGPKNMRSFDAWKVNRKHNELNELPYEKLAAAMWNRTDNKTPKEKMQFIVDQCAKQFDMEMRDREFSKEVKKRGRIRAGTFEGWKKRNNIITAFTVTDGTATAIEFDHTRDGEVIVENVEEVKADKNVEEAKADENIEDGVSVPLSEGGGV
ncbi:unnamed protein product [Meloidogyne enterolobii]|uniref:Uncharacterized protein n=1 Tax=Meloidogyne enterolobii TaxID=390850 RepID=A0ACB0ZZ11_MELEN